MRNSSNKFWITTLILALALSLVAIPALAQQGGQQPEQTATPSGEGDQQQGDQEGQAGQPQGTQGQAGQFDRIEIEISSEGIVAPQALPFGTIILWVTNSDTVPHNIRIQGPGVERQFLSPIQPGATKTLRVEILEGSYTLSTLEDDGESGMSTEVPVVVQPGASTMEDQQGGPTGQQGGQQAQPTSTPTQGAQEGQQATPSPTPGGEQTGGQPGQQTPTPGDQQNGQQAQQTPTPSDQQQGQQDDQQVPVTGPQQGFSVAQVAQPDQAGQIDLDIQLVKVADGFVDPVNVVAAPDDSGRLFVVERNGVVRVVQPDGQVLDEPFLDISDQTLDAFLEQGLYDLEFHPDFANNGKFYVHFAELLRNGDSMIVEYTVSADNPDQANPDSARVIMQIDQPWANHNGGELAFGPDGYLYIGSGDGGWEGDPLEAGQDLSTLLGKLLRIDVNRTDGVRQYGIPEDNPFTNPERLVQLFDITEEEFAQIHTQARPEIWAYGLRNPWKFQFDPQTGDLYLPDVGQNHWEEINFQPANSQGGENYGWDFLMGTYCFPINEESCEPIGVLPVAEYSHDLGNAVVGIGVYRGDQFAQMDGIYFVADWGSGRIWGLQQTGESQTNEQQNQGEQQGDQPFGEWTFTELLDSDLRITGSGQAADGTLYVTSCNCEYGGPQPVENPPGALWRIVPADQVPEGAETAPGQVPVTGQEGQPAQQTPTPSDQQQAQPTPTPTQGAQEGQQATPTPGGESQQATPSPTPGGEQTGGQQGQPGDNQQLVQQGEQEFSNNCARCHGQDGQGGIGPALAGNQFVTSQDPSQVIQTVLHGRGQMPAFSDQLSNEQIAAVVSYIRNAWGNNASTVSPEQISGGQEGQQTPTPGDQQDVQQGQQTPTPSDQQQAQPTPTPTQGAQEGQQLTPTPSGEGGQQDTTSPTPGGEQTGQDQPADSNRLAMEGGELYGTICAACHMPGGVGTGPFPPLNNNSFVTSEGPQPVARVVLTGRAGMPAFLGDLTTREIAAILTFIRTAWDNNASPVSVEQVEQIQQQIETERQKSIPGPSDEGGDIGH